MEVDCVQGKPILEREVLHVMNICMSVVTSFDMTSPIVTVTTRNRVYEAVGRRKSERVVVEALRFSLIS
jgi:hypothetical protein